MRRNPVFWRKKPRVPTYVSRVVSHVSCWQRSGIKQHGNCMDAAGSTHNKIYIIPLCGGGGGGNNTEKESMQPIYENVNTSCLTNNTYDDDFSSQSSWDDNDDYCTTQSINTCYKEVGAVTVVSVSAISHDDSKTTSPKECNNTCPKKLHTAVVTTRTKCFDRTHLPAAPKKPPNIINKALSAPIKHSSNARSIATQCDEISSSAQCDNVSGSSSALSVSNRLPIKKKKLLNMSSALTKDCQTGLRKSDDVNSKIKPKIEITKSNLLFTTNTQVNQLMSDTDTTVT